MNIVVIEKGKSMATTPDFMDKYPGDEGSIVPEQEGRVLQQQWVTLTASMWPEPTASPRGWRVSSDRIPLLAAVFCGASLVVCLLFAFVIYRCCIMPKKEKHYCLRKVDASSIPNPQNAQATYPSQAAVYAEPKGCSWGYTNRLVACNAVQGGQWFQNNRMFASQQCTQCPGVCPVVPRSTSHPGTSAQIPHATNNSARRQRPVSQPIGLVIPNGDMSSTKQIPMPEISEFSPQNTQYASSSILDEVGTKEEEEEAQGTATLKTRSLPAWVRSKPRPLSTEDDLNDLYAKVNFSKKRKNRMRNDEAAIIALSKSRSQFLHKDTDSLVDNEAVIVYDERTAL